MTVSQGRPWLAIFICLALALWMTGPVWIAEEPSFIGHWGALDLPGSVWAHWWVAASLADGHSPFIDTVSFHPIGLDPVLQYNIIDAIVGAPWVWLFGVRIGYNVATVIALTTTGFGGYILGRGAQMSWRGAIFVAFAIQSSSAIALELYEGRLSQFLLVFFLLALAALQKLIHTHPNGKTALWLGVSAALTALVYWYAGLFLILAAAVMIGVSRSQLNRQRLMWIGCSVIVGAALVLPFVAELASQWSSLPGMQRSTADPTFTTNVVSLKTGREIAVENSRWILWPLLSRANQEAGHQLGLIPVLFVVLALRQKKTGLASWLTIAAFGWVLALGPVFHGYSSSTDVSAPFGWLQDLSPLFARMWWPQRFEILTAVGISMAAGFGIDLWLKDRQKATYWWFLALFLCVADAPVRSGVLPSRASVEPTVYPGLYEGLDGAVITTPIHPPVQILNHQRFAQTQHELPIINGNGEHIPSHAPAAWTRWIDNSKVLTALNTLQIDHSVDINIDPTDIQYLIDAGFKYASVDPSVYGTPVGRNWAATHGTVFTQLWGEPIRRHRGGAVWAVPCHRRLSGRGRKHGTGAT